MDPGARGTRLLGSVASAPDLPCRAARSPGTERPSWSHAVGRAPGLPPLTTAGSNQRHLPSQGGAERNGGSYFSGRHPCVWESVSTPGCPVDPGRAGSLPSRAMLEVPAWEGRWALSPPLGGRCVIAEHPPRCDAGKQVRVTSLLMTLVEIPTGESRMLRSLCQHRGPACRPGAQTPAA